MGTEQKSTLVGTSFQLRPEQRDALRKIADERQVSLADVVREAVRAYLAADAARRQEPVAA